MDSRSVKLSLKFWKVCKTTYFLLNAIVRTARVEGGYSSGKSFSLNDWLIIFWRHSLLVEHIFDNILFFSISYKTFLSKFYQRTYYHYKYLSKHHVCTYIRKFQKSSCTSDIYTWFWLDKILEINLFFVKLKSRTYNIQCTHS